MGRGDGQETKAVLFARGRGFEVNGGSIVYGFDPEQGAGRRPRGRGDVPACASGWCRHLNVTLLAVKGSSSLPAWDLSASTIVAAPPIYVASLCPARFRRS